MDPLPDGIFDRELFYGGEDVSNSLDEDHSISGLMRPLESDFGFNNYSDTTPFKTDTEAIVRRESFDEHDGGYANNLSRTSSYTGTLEFGQNLEAVGWYMADISEYVFDEAQPDQSESQTADLRELVEDKKAADDVTAGEATSTQPPGSPSSYVSSGGSVTDSQQSSSPKNLTVVITKTVLTDSEQKSSQSVEPQVGSFDNSMESEMDFEEEIISPRRAKRMIANRESANRSRVKKLARHAQLEINVRNLRTFIEERKETLLQAKRKYEHTVTRSNVLKRNIYRVQAVLNEVLV
ncbi:hypothetical protein CYMTET_29457 [Cymbomonas tetramitiformis]|uniref:BZIP domain-containing protein n=1 Tax=Cymbomonas tetramitiformis TaxID=36881 RepID=A0AAE0FL19_9CHLO|nr:hypothetical protein CYMTET_29457 [Cymbomonas tetramitiformis]